MGVGVAVGVGVGVSAGVGVSSSPGETVPSGVGVGVGVAVGVGVGVGVGVSVGAGVSVSGTGVGCSSVGSSVSSPKRPPKSGVFSEGISPVSPGFRVSPGPGVAGAGVEGLAFSSSIAYIGSTRFV